MLKKANKQQIIKNIDIENAFIDESSFYIPVTLNVAESLFFDIEKICVSIIPKNFVYNHSSGNSLGELQSLNKGFSLLEKPLFVKKFSNNNKSLGEIDIEQESSNNNIFKYLYSKNIVSSKGQEEFLEYQTAVFFDEQGVSQTKTFVNVIPLSLIEEKTVSVNRFIEGDDRPLFIYSDIIINVYAINSKKEIIDNFSIESKKINEYEVNTNAEAVRLIEIENALSSFTNSFDILFTPYNFPISENYRLGSLNGIDVSFNKDILNAIFIDRGFSNETVQRLNINLFQNDVNTSYNLTSIRSFDFFRFGEINSRQGNNFSNSLINDSNFQVFTNNICDYLDINNLNEIEIDVSFNLVYTSSNINITKRIIVNKNSIKHLKEDFLKYKFEKDLVQKKVIFANLSKFRNNTVTDVYKLTLGLNLENYSKSDIIESGISLTFVKKDYSVINSIETFFFDDALTEGNSIAIDSSNIIKNYFLEENRLVLYFPYTRHLEYDDIIGCYINFFNEGSRESLSIGLFSTITVNESLRSLNTELLNIYDLCSNLLIRQTSFVTDSSDTEFLRAVLNIEEEYYYKINMTNLISNSDLKKIGYFSNADDSIQEKINQIIGNVILKSEKILKIDGVEIKEKVSYDLMSDIYQNYENVNGKISVTLQQTSAKKLFENFDVERILLGTDFLDFIKSIRTGQKPVYSTDDYVTYTNKVSYIIMKEGTIANFGETNNVASYKQNIMDFIISSNPNFKATIANSLKNKLYSNLYFSNKAKDIEKIFNISGFEQNNFFNKEMLVKKSLFNTNQSVDVIENNNVTPVINLNDITNMLFENAQKCTSNIKANLFNSKIILQKIKKGRDFVLQGSEVSRLINEYQNSDNSFIQSAFFYPEIVLDPEFNFSNNLDSEELVFLKDDEKAFITFKNRNVLSDYMNQLAVSIENDQIIANIVKKDIDFKRFNKDYYSLILNYLEQERRRALPRRSESFFGRSRSRERVLLVSNIVIRVCIVYNINNLSYLLTKNVIIDPVDNLKAYVNYNSYRKSKRKLNINFLDLENNIYMPSISYKGMKK